MKKLKISFLLGFIAFNFLSGKAFSTEIKNENYIVPIYTLIKSFDPAELNLNDKNSTEIINNLYNTLVTFKNNKQKSLTNYELFQPDLADSWNITTDKKTYNFKIRSDVYFHNKRKMDAFDVKHTFERLANPKNNFKYSFLFKDLPIKGLSDFRLECLNNEPNPNLKGIKVLDKGLVQITLDKPSPLALSTLSLPVFSIIPKEVVDKYKTDFSKNPIGTGPFFLSSFEKNKIVLNKNEQYFESNIPKVNHLTYKLVRSEKEASKLFFDKKITHFNIPDFMIKPFFNSQKNNKFGINVFNLNQFSDLKKAKIIKEPLLISTFLGINQRNNVFKHKKVRQALNYAVNKSEIISDVLNYKAIEPVGITPSGFDNYHYSNTKAYYYDQYQAKKLLYESGVIDNNGDGLLDFNYKTVSLDLWFYENKEAKEVCEKVKKDLEKIGFVINLHSTDDFNNFIMKIKSGSADLYFFSWKPIYPDLDKFFTPAFSSNYLNSSNITAFSNRNVDKLLNYASGIYDEVERNKTYGKIERILLDESPWLLLYQPVEYTIVQPYVFGLKNNHVVNNIYSYVYFDAILAKPFIDK